MSRIRYAIAAAVLLGMLWAQTAPPSAPTPEQPHRPAPQSQPPDASTPPAPSAPPASTPPPDSKMLIVTKRVKAAYPIEAAQEKLQGEVVLKVVVSETGDVESAEVVSGHPVLAKAAISAVKKWKFQPFIKNGKPRKVSTTFPFDFAFSDKILVDNTSKATNDGTDTSASKPVPMSPGGFGCLRG